jgi:hypothetical protein
VLSAAASTARVGDRLQRPPSPHAPRGIVASRRTARPPPDGRPRASSTSSWWSVLLWSYTPPITRSGCTASHLRYHQSAPKAPQKRATMTALPPCRPGCGPGRPHPYLSNLANARMPSGRCAAERRRRIIGVVRVRFEQRVRDGVG